MLSYKISLKKYFNLPQNHYILCHLLAIFIFPSGGCVPADEQL